MLNNTLFNIFQPFFFMWQDMGICQVPELYDIVF